MSKDKALLLLEEAREQLLAFVNTSIDNLKISAENGETLTGPEGESSAVETIYPLNMNPALFKGTKPTAIYFGEEMVEVKTWRKAYTLILQRCAAIHDKHERLMYLRGRVSGRKRVILSGKPDGMDAPIKIAEGLFAEGYFDTEWLLKVLTVDILDVVRFDYSGISVSVVSKKARKPCPMAASIVGKVFEGRR